MTISALLAIWGSAALAACGPIVWTARANMGAARDNLAAAVAGGTLYVAGGSNGFSLGTFEAYNPVTNTWVTKATMSPVRQQLGAAALGGSVYVIGGMNGPTLNTVQVYDPATNSWTARTSLPTVRLGMGIVSVGGTLYSVAGYNGAWTGDLLAYDPATNSWTTLATSPTPRAYLGVAAIGGTIYAFGGSNAGVYLATVEAYDIATNTWTTKPSLPGGVRGFLAGAAIGGTVYAIGGYNGSDLGRVESYDPATNTWATEPSLPAARRALAAATLAGTVYVVGGSTGASYQTANVAGTGCPLPFVPIPPSAPGSVTAIAVSQQVTLGWTPAVAGNSPITGYQIWRATCATCTSTFSATVFGPSATTYADTGLVNGLWYYYRVATVDTFGSVTFSATVSGKPMLYLPGPPGTLTALAGYQHVDLNWSPAPPGSYPLSAYEVWRATCATCAEGLIASVVVPGATTYDDTGVTNGLWYYYQVRVVDTLGNPGSFSVTASGRPLLYPLAAPTGLVATGGALQVVLTWGPATGGALPLTAYAIWRASCMACQESLTASVYNNSASTYLDAGLAADVWYYYQVAAVYTGGSVGPFSNTAAGMPSFVPTLNCLAWTAMASVPTLRSSLGVTAAAGLVYAVGGDNGTALAVNERYDPATNVWTTLAPMPTARSLLGAATVGGTVYAAGGKNGTRLATLEAYDPATNTWTAKAPMPTAREWLSVAALGGLVYAVGGFTPLLVGTVEAYNPVTNSWSTKAPMPTPRFGFALAALGGTLYAMGGNNPEIATVEAYDPATDSWTTKAPLLFAERDLAAAVIGGTLFALGGFSYSSNGGIVEAYDPATNTWTIKASIPTNPNAFGAATVGSTIYAVGGWGGAVGYSTNEAGTPAECPIAPAPPPSSTGTSEIMPGYGRLLILPNVLNAASPSAVIKFVAHGNAGERTDIGVYSDRGMGLGTLSILLDSRGLGTAFLPGPRLGDRSLSPGIYYALAEGGGVHDKKLFAVVVR